MRHAIEGTHTFNSSDGKTAFYTRWEDTQSAADDQALKFRADGCYFTRVFKEPRGILGVYRIVGHKLLGEP